MMSKEAMKLAQKWQQTDWNTESPMSVDFAMSEANDVISALMDALREALEKQPAQTATYTCGVCGVSMQMEQPAQQEPVAWYRDEDGIRIYYESKAWDDATPLYTSPPQRIWVGLTDAEWMNIVNKDHAWFGQRPEDVAHEVAKLIEAKLKEKNT